MSINGIKKTKFAQKYIIPKNIKKRLSLSSFFQLLCVSFTIFFIYGEIETYLVTKPTVTSNSIEPLGYKNFPEILVCADPAFDQQELSRNGYVEIWRYVLGLQGPTSQFNFTGWNGNGVGSSVQLLDRISTLKTVKEVWAYELKDIQSYKYAKRILKNTIYPYGRCVKISHKTQNFQNAIQIIRQKSNSKTRVLFRDPVNSADMIPISFEMTGDRVERQAQANETKRMRKTYKIKIKQNIQEIDDPKSECQIYTLNTTFDFCTSFDILTTMNNYLGCFPPLLSPNINKTCNTFIHKSENESQHIISWIDEMYKSYQTKNCKKPCTHTTFETALLEEVASDFDRITLRFDQEVDITRSVFSINTHTFLTRLGGSVSLGRTSLWIFLSILGCIKLSWNALSKFRIIS